MARANLNVSKALTERFIQAQESKDIRLLVVKIQNEDLVVERSLNKTGSASDDFNRMLCAGGSAQITEDQACLVLFNLSNDSICAQSWLMIPWIPEHCPVREKMLFTSSRDDLKRSLGLGYFKASDYAANHSQDMSWSQYMESINNEVTMDILTETERLVLEEKVLRMLLFTYYNLELISSYDAVLDYNID